MEIGIDSFAAILPDPVTAALPSPTERMADLLAEVELADRVGLDVFGIGEGWAHLTATIGRERGWSPPTRAQFDAMAGPEGAFLVGAPGTVVAKMQAAGATLGELTRITFQMSTASQDTGAMQRSIELLGTEVAPAIRAARERRWR